MVGSSPPGPGPYPEDGIPGAPRGPWPREYLCGATDVVPAIVPAVGAGPDGGEEAWEARRCGEPVHLVRRSHMQLFEDSSDGDLAADGAYDHFSWSVECEGGHVLASPGGGGGSLPPMTAALLAALEQRGSVFLEAP